MVSDDTLHSTGEFDSAAFLRSLTGRPGVYRMLGEKGEVLYVGKARNLKRRVSSYFRKSGLPPKTRALMAQVRGVEVTVTHTEGEALLLENNLIKELHPRYNVLLRDDKSYPWIHLTAGESFPRLALHRGARREGGRYFGPYPSAGAARESLNLLQKLFRVRQCRDSFFRNRSRPCLQYQIGRCTAPCVGRVSEEAYARDVENTVRFLEGRSNEVIENLARRMEEAAERLEYEEAARLRDQIAALSRVQERQYVAGGGSHDLDVVAAVIERGAACVQVFFIRAGHNLGNKVFHPSLPPETSVAELLAEFVSRYYGGDHAPPPEILLSEPLEERELLERALSERAGRKVILKGQVRGERARWVKLAVQNARHALRARLASRDGMDRRLEALRDALGLPQVPSRMECFDISHTMGEATVASCVVFGADGPLKSDYRRFNIEGVTPGDDYGAMRQALSRRYTRLKKGEGVIPDLLVIDGGKGQLAVAAQVLEELQVEEVTLLGVAKGPERRPGEETLFLSGSEHPIILPGDSPALHLIQQIRDEAHRFAITGHRQRRARTRGTSVLERIPGVGPKRRRLLLTHFGGLKEVARAGVEDLARVPGIDRQLAQKVYDAFHSGE
ncbi:MAG TPA: excinuclease ABC subunit UvrC [Thiotrichales bacterium]|nr:excinuclease ABC subunit UvrC [Thiotrichales bacterium]